MKNRRETGTGSSIQDKSEAPGLDGGGVRHLITPEYPPMPGGVGDYTKLIGEGLAAAGEEIHIWCPFLRDAQSPSGGVVVHGEFGGATPQGLRRLGQQLDMFPAPRRILVQWTPHGYSYRSMNLSFCLWLWNRSKLKGDRIEIMVHEAFLFFGEGSWRQDAAAVVHRLMTVILLQTAERVWMSIPMWEEVLRPFLLGRKIPFQWLPIPSNIAPVESSEAIQRTRQRYADEGSLLIGHFGTYSQPMVSVLEPILLRLADTSPRHLILLMGYGSEEFRHGLVQKKPELGCWLQATGALPPEVLSCHLSACDLMIQPYRDGVSSRRTSVMAALSHGKPVVTTSGHATEALWAESGAVVVAPENDTETFVRHLNRLCSDSSERARLGKAARRLYKDRFDIAWTAAALKGSVNQMPPVCVG